MDLSKIKSACEFGPMPNVVIIFETVQNAIVQDLNKKLDNMGETWQETKDAMSNLKIATKEALRVRGETARRIEERDFWRQEYEKEKEEREQLQEELNNLKIELNKVKENKKVKNECILVHNTNLMKKLEEEQHSKVILINEILDQKSTLNRMKLAQRRHLLQEMRSNSLQDLEKLAVVSEKRNSSAKLAESGVFVTPKKASFV